MSQLLDRNNLSVVEKKIDEKVKHTRIGTVLRIWEHAAPNDFSNFEATVLVDGDTVQDGEEEKRAQINMIGGDSIDIPKVGDKVIVAFKEGQKKPPIIISTAWDREDRPPIGLAGMYRRRFDGGDSPVGKGNLYLTGYTRYDKNPASGEAPKQELKPEETTLRLEKRREYFTDPLDQREQEPDIPMKLEMYDSEKNDEAYITLEANVVDGTRANGMYLKLDPKEGTITMYGEKHNGDETYTMEMDIPNETFMLNGETENQDMMGMFFDFDQETFKIADGNRFGIESDGKGNFTWSHKSIEEVTEDGDVGSIDVTHGSVYNG